MSVKERFGSRVLSVLHICTNAGKTNGVQSEMFCQYTDLNAFVFDFDSMMAVPWTCS